MSAAFEPRIEPFGDRAVLISISDRADVACAARTHALTERIAGALGQRPGWRPPVPTATSVLVPVDPVEPGVEAALAVLSPFLLDLDSLVPDERWSSEGPPIEIPVRYGGADGPDLETVAELTGLTPSGVIELHAGAAMRVFFLGFAPGFGYLGPLPEGLVVPRRPSPRTRVPAGSVAIAGPHAAVYPVDSPGGWHLLGRTSTVLWNPSRTPPATLRPGDLVRFVPGPRG